jgi:hypothetical protein
MKKILRPSPFNKFGSCMVVWICVCWFSFCWVTVCGCIISSQSPIERLQISSPPQKTLKQKEKLIFVSTFVLSLNLDENFMGIAILYFASLCLFFRRFFEVVKINFVTKSAKLQICEKHQITNFFAQSKIKREKYFKESIFLKFFDIC